MNLPYGISDFYQIITEGYRYFDRTDRIPLLEGAGKSLLFLRPRRFGKSLLLTMLENYYDVAKAAEFERLFGQLAIGRNPTPLHNQCLVMKWDFSKIDPSGGVDEIKQSLHNYLHERIAIFIDDYRPLLHSEIRHYPNDALVTFESLVAAVRRTPYHFYLFIDEYDNFANEVMMAGQQTSRSRYEALVIGEGLFKTVFKYIKGSGAGQGLDRVFITGVSPIVLSDVTSGHNIAKNLTWRRQFNDLCGFTAAEVRPLVEEVIVECGLPPAKADEAMELMRVFYNGSCFTWGEAPLVYNPTLTFYFLGEFELECRYPDKMLDGNLAPDYSKLVYVSHHPMGEPLLQAALNDQSELSVTEIGDRFGLAEMLETSKQRDLLASLLCYLGVLTYAGRTAKGEYRLVIPNLVTRRLYAERLLELFFPAAETRDLGRDAAKLLYMQGEMQPVCTFVEQTYFRVLDNRDYLHADELTVKMAFLTLVYNDILYVIDSEAALERTYADLTMIIRPEMRRFQLLDILIEFKYVALNKTALSGAEIKQKTMTELKELTPVKEKLTEAKTQLWDYQQKLARKYGEQLRLRSYSVVAIGFDRVVWEEIA